jgi:putative DNA primase/helicase
MPIDHPDFRRAMMEDAGLVPPANLVSDRRTHRCQVEGKKRSNRAGSYMLTEDGGMGGFRNWAAGGEWVVWQAAKPSQLTPEQRAEILRVGRQATAKRLADEERLRQAARLKAVKMWSKAVEGQHPYLDRKGICSNGSRVLWEMLLVPVRDFGGHIHSVQMIAADGAKKFLPGGRVKGCCHWIRCGQQTGPVVYVCEGFATGSTIHAAMGGRPVVVAYNCGNLLPVCQELRRRLPTARIVVCADNDHATEGNPGLTHAREAATAAHARLAVPEGMTGTDFNDVQAELGITNVTRQLSTTRRP